MPTRSTGSFFTPWESVLLFLFLITVCFPPYHEACADGHVVRKLIRIAKEKALDQHPYWHTLLHYKPRPRGGKSLVDDPDFFLSPDGKHNPAAELEATLEAFFQPVIKERDHAVCRFAARFQWLSEQLPITPDLLPMRRCEPFDDFYESVNPDSVSLVFATAHMNSPASMFGHTLLTIDTSERTRLLSHAVNYAAVAGQDPGLLFALKGLFGFYPGYFSLLPYYEKIQEYTDVNHRDIWEYPLKLTAWEIRRMLLHAWESDLVWSDYYFIDENCSYTLLFLLEAARPGLDLTDQFSGWVIPLDTIRVVQKAGLAGQPEFRPSKTTTIQHLASRLDPADQVLACNIALGRKPVSELDARQNLSVQRNDIADLAVEYLQYQYSRKKMAKEVYRERLLGILASRSRGGSEIQSARPAAPVPPAPETGHQSSRLALGAASEEGKATIDLRLRIAYHELLDPGVGYKEGAQIIFGEIFLRHYPDQQDLELRELNVIDIVSLAPRDLFFRPYSWKVRTGLYRRLRADGSDTLVAGLNPGVGITEKLSGTGLGYLMLEADLNVGGDLDHGYAGGVGGSAGALVDITDWWKLAAQVRDIQYGLGDVANLLELSIRQGFLLTPNISINVNGIWSRVRDRDETEIGVQFNFFF